MGEGQAMGIVADLRQMDDEADDSEGDAADTAKVQRSLLRILDDDVAQRLAE